MENRLFDSNYLSIKFIELNVSEVGVKYVMRFWEVLQANHSTSSMSIKHLSTGYEMDNDGVALGILSQIHHSTAIN